jgi:hypothetical protein
MSLTIYCPPGETSIWQTQVNIKGSPQMVTYAPRLHTNGRYVLDVPRGFYTGVILRCAQSKLWMDENHEVGEWLGKNDSTAEVNDAFPGKDRPPVVAPITTEVEPVMMRMRAPVGTSSCSHGGAEIKIGKDGTVTVDEHVGDVLKSFGFVPV